MRNLPHQCRFCYTEKKLHNGKTECQISGLFYRNGFL